MTIGVDFKVKNLFVDGQKVKLQILDFGVEERFRFLLPTYVRGALGGIFVYDVTNYSSFAHIDNWLSIVRKEIRAEDKFPIVAVGIVPDEKRERQVSKEKGVKIAKSRKLKGFIECYLKTGKNIDKAFEGLARLILADFDLPIRKREKGNEKPIKDIKGEKTNKQDKEYLITYTRHLEKKLRNLETEKLMLENQLRLEKHLTLRQELNSLKNEIAKYKNT